MNAIAIALILFVRVFLPFAFLLALGEWTHRHEINYWLMR